MSNNLLYSSDVTHKYTSMYRYSMNQKIQTTTIVVAVVSLLMISPLLNSDNVLYASGKGLKVNLSASSGSSGSGQYCVHGGGQTECQNASVPGSVQIQFGSGVVGEGDSIRGCVEFNGQTECDSGTNTSCKCPENLSVSFGNNNGGGSSSSSASSSSSSSSSSASVNNCLAFCGRND